MTTWRPVNRIRVIVVGLVWKDGKILAAEVLTDAGTVKGVRPLGGSIEFGETREEALRREFMEELAVEIDIVGPWAAAENLYEHEGHPGHEIVFFADVVVRDRSLYRQDWISFREDNLSEHRAGWFDPASLEHAGMALYPNGLAGMLRDRKQA
ncbi:NUDIX hydrolase [Rhizobium sp.]